MLESAAIFLKNVGDTGGAVRENMIRWVTLAATDPNCIILIPKSHSLFTNYNRETIINMNKSIRKLLEYEGKIPTYLKLTEKDIEEVMTFLAGVPAKEGKDGLSAQSYLSALDIPVSAVKESTVEGLLLHSDDLVPDLCVLDSLGEAVYTKDILDSYVLGVKRIKQEHLPYNQACIAAIELKAFIRLSNTLAISSFVTSSTKQYEHPRISGVCPYVLLAYKLYRGKSYGSWSRKEKAMSKILPKDLVKLPDFRDFPSISKKDKKEALRTMALAYPGKVPVTPAGRGLYSLVKAANYLERELTEMEALISTVPQTLQRMLLQTWAFNETHRTSDLILDFNDWDVVPEGIWEGFIGFANDGVDKTAFFSDKAAREFVW